MHKVVPTSAAQEAASILREMILRENRKEEWLLGSEDHVMQALEISKPTLRQALRVLEQEQLIAVRRGVGGGLFARPPSEEGVTHMSSVYLRSDGTTYGDLIQTLSVLSVHSAAEAARNPSRAARVRLTTYYVDQIGDENPEELTGEQFVVMAGRFFVELATLAQSPTIKLFTSVLIDLARPAAGRSLYNTERILATIDRHTRVAEAVAAGKADLAAKRLKVHFDEVLNWTEKSIKLESMQLERSPRR